MTSTTLTLNRPFAGDWQRLAAPAATAALLALLFYTPMLSTARQWWDDPDAGHGLLLAPLAIYLAWKRGLIADARPQPVLGLALLLGAVVLRYVSGLAAELFTMRLSMFGAFLALTVFYLGARQLLQWWLPLALLLLSIPLPAVILGSIAVPLQFKASQIGAALLEWRHVPVFVDGNVIRIPGRDLFVTEACSGLRSLASLIALGVLIGGLWLRTPLGRIAILLVTIPVAIALNGIRVFLTGFLVFFVDPKLGEGFMHMTEGWLLFMVAFLILGATAWGVAQLEQMWRTAR